MTKEKPATPLLRMSSQHQGWFPTASSLKAGSASNTRTPAGFDPDFPFGEEVFLSDKPMTDAEFRGSQAHIDRLLQSTVDSAMASFPDLTPEEDEYWEDLSRKTGA